MNQEKPKIFRCNDTFIWEKVQEGEYGGDEEVLLSRVSYRGKYPLLPTFNRFDCFAQAFAGRIFGEPHNRIFDPRGIGDLAENEAFFFAGGLHMHVAEIEDCRNDPFDGWGNILDAGKVEFAYLADE